MFNDRKTGTESLFSLVMKLHHFLERRKLIFVQSLPERHSKFREVVDQNSLTLNNKYIR